MTDDLVLDLPTPLVKAEVVIDPAATPPVNPEVLTVEQCTVIVFRIAESARPRYSFSTALPPIVVHRGAESFGTPNRRTPYLVTMVDEATVEGDFSYTINLVDALHGGPVSMDPLIRNEG